MAKFSISDRVAVYSPYRKLGTLVKKEGIFCYVQLDRGDYSRMYHPKQLRKLKPKVKSPAKAPREWDLIKQHDFRDVAIGPPRPNDNKPIRVTELPPGSVVVTREDLGKAWDTFMYPTHSGSFSFQSLCKALNLPSPEGKGGKG